MELLSKRQKEILEYVRGFVAEAGYAPSLSEIASHFGLSSPATVYEHMRALQEKGYLERGWNKKRSLRFTGKSSAPASGAELPLLGVIAAGQPIEAVLDNEVVAVPAGMARDGRCFALRVRGSSMIDDHICDGDLVVVRSTSTAENGATVVALVDGTQATLKRYYRDGRKVRLQPANDAMAPIVVDEDQVTIQGLVVGIIRQF